MYIYILINQKKKYFMKAQETIIKFKISRGGRFNNAGYLTFSDTSRINEGYTFDDLFLNEETGEYLNDSGNEVGLTQEEAETGIGRIDQDGEYDTTYTLLLSEINSKELSAIKEANEEDLINALVEYFEAEDEDSLFMYIH